MSLARSAPRPAASSELREALSACWHAFIARRADERPDQYSVPDRLVLHARGLRPGAAEPQHPDAGRALDPGADAVRLSGRARRHPLAHPGPRRRDARRAAERARLRHRGAAAAALQDAGRRPRAAARSRSDPRLPRQHRPARAVRSAVDADLSADLLSVPSWIGIAALVGAVDPDQPDAHVGIHDAPAVAHGHDACRRAQQSRRCRPAQRRGAAGDGHGAAHGQDLGRGQHQVSR